MRTKFGQNFLVDPAAARKIVDALDISGSDTVVEIGPGKGILTELLAPRARELFAVELDRKLSEELEKKFSSRGNVKVVCRDFLLWDVPASGTPASGTPASGTPQGAPPGALKFIGNLPYCSATAIIQKVIGSRNWSSAVFTVQQEVAQRIVSGPGSRVYGALSAIVKFNADAEIMLKIPPGCFRPAPKVNSAVVKFRPGGTAGKYAEGFGEKLFEVIHAAFSHRRKTVYNSLLGSSMLKGRLVKDELLEILDSCGITPSLRPENLELEKYIELTRGLTARGLVARGLDNERDNIV